MNRRKLLFVVLIMLVTSGMFGLTKIDVNAAKAKYTKKRVNYSYTYKGTTVYSKGKYKIKVKEYYDKILLKGSSKAVVSINEDLKSKYKSIRKGLDKKSGKKVKKSASANIGYYENTWKSNVTFINDDIVSIKMYNNTFSGGIHNFDHLYGYTYSLKTGKLMSLNDVLQKNDDQIRDSIISEYKGKYKEAYEYEESGIRSALDNLDISKLTYYFNSKGKVVIYFNTYDIGPYIYGSTSVTLPMNLYES